jgi:hypothetical protein
MTAALKHWATPLIGCPWRAGATGPDGFDCRGLVRHVWRTRRGHDVAALMPEVMHDAQRLLAAAHADGFTLAGRGAAFRGREYDIVTMRGIDGPHVGVLIEVDGTLRLLHAVGGIVDGREIGEVVCQPLADAQRLGFGRFEFWRRGVPQEMKTP